MSIRRISFIIIVCVLSYTTCFSEQVINMIDNCSFEICLSNGSTPFGWRFYTNEGSTFVWGASPLSNAKNVYCQRTSTTGDTVLDNWDHMVPVSPGIGYKFQFYAKGSGQLQVTIGWRDRTHTTISQTNSYYTLTGSYVRQDISATSPSGSAECWIAFRVNGTGHFYVDDVRQWINSYAEYSPTGYSNLNYNNVPQNRLALVTPVGGDGNTQHAWLWGRLCRNTLNTASGHYMYFSIDDAYIYNEPNGAAIVVEYADVGTDLLEINYDSDGAVYQSTNTLTKSNSLQWKRSVFYLDDVKFANRQNGSSDFRINDCGDGAEFISYVAVYKWHGTRISDGSLLVDENPTFLKIGSLCGAFATTDYSYVVPHLAGKGYTAMKLDTYWNNFDSGSTYTAATKLNNVISSCDSESLAVGVSFERYNVGGVGTPDFIFNWYNAQAKNSSGNYVIDTEYQTNVKVPSLSSRAYNNRGRAWMNWLLLQIDKSKILWYEPWVEPQYIGNQLIDYSTVAHDAWRTYLAERWTLASLNSSWGTSYSTYDQITMPLNSSDAKWNMWHDWRAAALAQNVNEDMQTIRNVVGESALLASDMLIINNMENRMGNKAFFAELVSPNIFQINWHWWDGQAYDDGYDLCLPIAARKNIAISEHMTLNGSDFTAADVDKILKRTLYKGNRFGWEFIRAYNDSNEDFSLYNTDWSPKAVIDVVDDQTAYYLHLAHAYMGTCTLCPICGN